MRIAFGLVLLFMSSSLVSHAQSCLNAAREVPPVLSPETRAIYEKNLAAAEAVHLAKPNEPDSIIWLGRRMAYLGRYKDAARVFSSGLVLHKNDPRLLRHRGHRLITLRCFDDAINDLERAAALIKGEPDEVEPDGIPNRKNIPTSTLQSNIWYHLGLAYYLKGDFARALKAYGEAQKVSKNNDMRVATAYWHYMTLRNLGERSKAKKLLDQFSAKIDLIENHDYLKLIHLFQGEAGPDDLPDPMATTVSNATLGYGLGFWFLDNEQREVAVRIFRKIVDGNQWASFGYIAAEAELKRHPK